MKPSLSKVWIFVTFCLPVLTLISHAVAGEKPSDASNRVPYISTYYRAPKASLSENVVINYYVTDYDQKGYRKGDTVETFTIDYWVNGDKKSLNKIPSGDGSIDLGVLPKGRVLFALQATDKHGLKSHRLFQEFLVTDPAHDTIPADKILTPDLGKFNISSADTNPAETTAGLSALLKWASTQGYRKVVLPRGIYRMDENAPVQMATKLTLDMSGSTFKLNPNAKDKGLMLDFINCFDSHVVNGTFEGDLQEHDFAKAPNPSAWVDGISLSQGSEYCSVENITIKDITGSGITTRHGLPASQPKKITGFTRGDRDAHGQKTPSTVRVTTDNFISIADEVKTYGYIQVGCPQGEQGNPIDNWVYHAHFYDASQKYIETIEGYLYRRLYPPTNATFVKFTLLSKIAPETLSVFNARSPYNCALLNITPLNNRSAGIAPKGFEHLLIEGCRFTSCGSDLNKSAFYVKDGFDSMQDLTFINNAFVASPNDDVAIYAGHNSIVEGKLEKITFLDRAHSFVLRNTRKIVSLRLSSESKVIRGYCRVQNSGTRGSISIREPANGSGDWKFIVNNCSIEGQAEAPGGIFFRCSFSGEISDTELSRGILGTGKFTNCYIHDMVGHNRGGVFRNCKIERVSGTIQTTIDVDACVITDWNCNVIGNGTTFSIKNSKLNNFLLTFGFWFKGANTIIDGCTINNWDYMLRIPFYSMKEPVTLSNNTFTTLGSKGMVAFYHDVVGKSAGFAVEQEPLTLINNTLNLGDSDYVVTGPNATTQQKIKLVFEKNSITPKTVQLYNPDAKKSENISITER